MPVLQDLAHHITRAVGIETLSVQPIQHSKINETVLLKGAGQAFYAKIFRSAAITALDPKIRYDREMSILSRTWSVPTPSLIYHSDDERVVVTREVLGDSFQDFIAQGRSLEALGMMARWLAGFHTSAPARPRSGTLWDHFSQFGELKRNPDFWTLQPLLSEHPIGQVVLTKGDCASANFKFTEKGAVGLDFEGVAFRAMEFDLVSLIRGLHALTGESVEAMVATVVEQYHSVRAIDQPKATAKVVKALVTVSDC